MGENIQKKLKELLLMILEKEFQFELTDTKLLFMRDETSISGNSMTNIGEKISKKITELKEYIKTSNSKEIEKFITIEDIEILKKALNKFINVKNYHGAEKLLDFLILIPQTHFYGLITLANMQFHQNNLEKSYDLINQLKYPSKLGDKLLYISAITTILYEMNKVDELKYILKKIDDDKEVSKRFDDLRRNMILNIKILEKDYDYAINSYQNEIDTLLKSDHPNSNLLSLLYSNLGLVQFEKTEIENAYHSYLKSKEYNPGSLRIDYQIGGCLERMNRTDEAIHIYMKILFSNPDDPKALNSLSNLITAKGDFNTAYKLLKKIENSNSYYRNDPYFLKNLAKNKSKMGLLEEAEKDFTKAIKLKPDLWELWYHRGYFYLYRKGDYINKSIVDFEKACDLFPYHPDNWNMLGNAYMTNYELENALICFEKAIDVDPEHFAATMNIGLIYFYTNRFNDAIIFFKKAIKIIPGHFSGHFYIGLCYHKKYQYRTAFKHLITSEKVEKPTEHQKENYKLIQSQLYHALFMVCFELELKDEAIKYAERFLKIYENEKGKEISDFSLVETELYNRFRNIEETLIDDIFRNLVFLLLRYKEVKMATNFAQNFKNITLMDTKRLISLTSLSILEKKYHFAESLILQNEEYMDPILMYFLGFVQEKQGNNNFKDCYIECFENLERYHLQDSFILGEFIKLIEYSIIFDHFSTLSKLSRFEILQMEIERNTKTYDIFKQLPMNIWFKTIKISLILGIFRPFFLDVLDKLFEISNGAFDENIPYWFMKLKLNILFGKEWDIHDCFEKLMYLNPSFQIIENDEIIKTYINRLDFISIRSEMGKIFIEDKNIINIPKQILPRTHGFFHDNQYYNIMDDGEDRLNYRKGLNNYKSDFLQNLHVHDKISKEFNTNNSSRVSNEEILKIKNTLDEKIFLNQKTTFSKDIKKLLKDESNYPQAYFIPSTDLNIIDQYNKSVENNSTLKEQYGLIKNGDIIGYFLQHIEENQKGNKYIIYVNGIGENIGRLSETILELICINLIQRDTEQYILSTRSSKTRLIKTITLEKSSYEPFFTLSGKKLSKPLTKIPLVYKKDNKVKNMMIKYFVPNDLISFCERDEGGVTADRRGRIKIELLKKWKLLDENSKPLPILQVLINALGSFFRVQYGKKYDLMNFQNFSEYKLTELLSLTNYKENLIDFIAKEYNLNKTLILSVKDLLQKSYSDLGNVTDFPDKFECIQSKYKIWEYVNPGIIDLDGGLPKIMFEKISAKLNFPSKKSLNLIIGFLGQGKSVFLGQLAEFYSNSGNKVYIVEPNQKLPIILSFQDETLIIIDNIDSLSMEQLGTINSWNKTDNLYLVATIQNERLEIFRNSLKNHFDNSDFFSKWKTIQFPKWTLDLLTPLITHELKYWGIETKIEGLPEIIYRYGRGNCTLCTGLVKNLRYKEKKVFENIDMSQNVDAMCSKINRLLSFYYIDDNADLLHTSKEELLLLWMTSMASQSSIYSTKYEEFLGDIDENEPIGIPSYLVDIWINNFLMKSNNGDKPQILSILTPHSWISKTWIVPDISWQQNILYPSYLEQNLKIKLALGGINRFSAEKWLKIILSLQYLNDKIGTIVFSRLRSIIKEYFNANPNDINNFVATIKFLITFFEDHSVIEFFPENLFEPSKIKNIFVGATPKTIELLLYIILDHTFNIFFIRSQEYFKQPVENLNLCLKIINACENLNIKIRELLIIQINGYLAKFYKIHNNFEEAIAYNQVSLKIARNKEENLDIIMELLFELQEIYLMQKDFASSENSFKMLFKLYEDKKDSINDYEFIFQQNLYTIFINSILLKSEIPENDSIEFELISLLNKAMEICQNFQLDKSLENKIQKKIQDLKN